MEERTCFNCTRYDVCRIRWQIADAIKDSMNIDSDDAPGTSIEVFRSVANACLLYKSGLTQTVEGNDLKHKVTQLRGALTSIVRYWNTPLSGDRSISDHVDHIVNIADKALKEIPE